MRRPRASENGSALVEAAIVLPCLLALICWSAALTDVLVLKLKAAEALRYALWESTVFKSPRQIDLDVRQRFADLRSPRRVNLEHTGLWLYPRARDLSWRADVDLTSMETSLGGAPGTSPDAAARTMRFNTHGSALARVTLARAQEDPLSPIPRGADLPGPSMRSLDFQAPLPSQRPMQLVFDSWKAWPKPAPYTFTAADVDPAISPSRTYPEVERQVSAQVRAIAFSGASRIPWFRELGRLFARTFRPGFTEALAGGTLPEIFSAGRMDERGSNRGPITILPPERDGPAWVPHRCEVAGKDVPCPTQRAGDVTTAGDAPRFIDGEHGIGDGTDRTRYTVPYRINTAWWRQPGGVDRELGSSRIAPVKAGLAKENAYVKSYRCRGHFFGGSRAAQRAGDYGSCR